MISLDHCFGDYDGVVIYEASDYRDALSMVLAVIAPGRLRATKSTELFTLKEMTDGTSPWAWVISARLRFLVSRVPWK